MRISNTKFGKELRLPVMGTFRKRKYGIFAANRIVEVNEVGEWITP